MTNQELIYISNVRLPTTKAHGLQIMKTCEAFSGQGMMVKLIVPKLKPTSSDDPLKYYGIKNTFSVKKIFVLEVLGLERWLGRWVGYVQNLSFSLAAVFYLLMTVRRRNQKIFYSRDYMTMLMLCISGYHPVVEMHDYRSKEYKKRIDFILRRAKKIIVNSEGTRAAILGHYKIPEGKLLVAPNGVDLEFFDIKLSREEARARLSITTKNKIVAYVGRLETVGIEKGISYLMLAFKELIASGNQIKLYVIGGPDELIAKYKMEARGLAIPDEDIIFAGQINYSDIPVYLRAVDVVTIPSPRNQHSLTTSPIKLFEYLASGKVIIVSDLPSLRRYLNEKTALFFEAGDSHDLANKIQLVLKDEILAEQLSQQALQDASAHTWTERAKNILKFIQ